MTRVLTVLCSPRRSVLYAADGEGKRDFTHRRECPQPRPRVYMRGWGLQAALCVSADRPADAAVLRDDLLRHRQHRRRVQRHGRLIRAEAQVGASVPPQLGPGNTLHQCHRRFRGVLFVFHLHWWSCFQYLSRLWRPEADC